VADEKERLRKERNRLYASNEMCQSFEKNFLQQTLTKNTIIRNGAYE